MYRSVTLKACVLFASLAVLAAPVAGCIPQPPKPAKAPQSLASVAPVKSSGCSAKTNVPWKPNAETFTVEAFTDGPDCAKAVAVLVIRNSKGETLWVDTFQAAQNLALSDAKTAAEMQPALAAWISQTDINGKPLLTTTGDLPVWGPSQTQPIRGEFPFYPEEGIAREDYTKLRAQKLPMFCYVQGIESEACLTLHEGAFEKIGAQSFPG